MIIIEGFENVGKSTLVQQLSKHFRLPQARTYYMPQTEEDIARWHNWANAAPRPLILDRHPAISDLVYGPILRNTTPSSLSLANTLRHGHFLIYCRPHWDTIKRTFNEREQMKGTDTHFDQLLEAYDRLMDELNPDAIYNWENPRSLPALITHLTHALERMK